MTLVCSNPNCDSNMNDMPPAHPMFTVSVTVGEDCDLTENLHHFEPGCFSCVYCHSEAIEGEDQ